MDIREVRGRSIRPPRDPGDRHSRDLARLQMSRSPTRRLALEPHARATREAAQGVDDIDGPGVQVVTPARAARQDYPRATTTRGAAPRPMEDVLRSFVVETGLAANCSVFDCR